MNRTARRLLPEDLDTAAPLLRVVDEALDVLATERQVFLSGDYERIVEITEAKSEILVRLEDLIPSMARSITAIRAMQRLVEASKQNEQIIQAARQGLSHAKRRISAIAQTGRGAVAYAEDGTRISSHADLMKADKSA